MHCRSGDVQPEMQHDAVTRQRQPAIPPVFCGKHSLSRQQGTVDEVVVEVVVELKVVVVKGVVVLVDVFNVVEVLLETNRVVLVVGVLLVGVAVNVVNVFAGEVVVRDVLRLVVVVLEKQYPFTEAIIC